VIVEDSNSKKIYSVNEINPSDEVKQEPTISKNNTKKPRKERIQSVSREESKHFQIIFANSNRTSGLGRPYICERFLQIKGKS
jgi:hypothetical protein